MTHHYDRCSDVLRRILATLTQTQSPVTFSEWLYQSEDAWHLLGDEYDALLSLDYSSDMHINDIHSHLLTVLKRLDTNAYELEIIRRLLCDVANRRGDLIAHCAAIAHYRMGNYSWLPALFAGIDSELDAAPKVEFSSELGPYQIAQAQYAIAPWVAHYLELAQSTARQVLSEQFPDIQCAL